MQSLETRIAVLETQMNKEQLLCLAVIVRRGETYDEAIKRARLAAGANTFRKMVLVPEKDED